MFCSFPHIGVLVGNFSDVSNSFTSISSSGVGSGTYWPCSSMDNFQGPLRVDELYVLLNGSLVA